MLFRFVGLPQPPPGLPDVGISQGAGAEEEKRVLQGAGRDWVEGECLQMDISV